MESVDWKKQVLAQVKRDQRRKPASKSEGRKFVIIKQQSAQKWKEQASDRPHFDLIFKKRKSCEQHQGMREEVVHSGDPIIPEHQDLQVLQRLEIFDLTYFIAF